MDEEFCEALVFLFTHSMTNDESVLPAFIMKLSNDHVERILKTYGAQAECLESALIIKNDVSQNGVLNHQAIIDLFAKYGII